MIIVPRLPSKLYPAHGLANCLLPCEVLYATARNDDNPKVVVFRSQATGEFITRIEMKIPDSIKLGLIGQAITDVIQTAELKGNSWTRSRMKSVEEKPILRKGRKPNIGKAVQPRQFRTLLYSI